MMRALCLVLLLGACDLRDPQTPPQPQPSDAGTQDDCSAMCDRLAELGCDGAEPTPQGDTCEEVCWNVESSGTITVCPAQVARARDCQEAELLSQCEAP